jgi:hypothetical protein
MFLQSEENEEEHDDSHAMIERTDKGKPLSNDLGKSTASPEGNAISGKKAVAVALPTVSNAIGKYKAGSVQSYGANSDWMKVKRSTLKSVTAMTGIGLKGTKLNPLDSFFPFDPCLLRLIHQVIERLYRSWKGLPGIDYDERDEYSDDEEDNDGHNSVYDNITASSGSNSDDDIDDDNDDEDESDDEINGDNGGYNPSDDMHMHIIDQTENEEENDNYMKLIGLDNGNGRHESFDSSTATPQIVIFDHLN